MIKQVLTSILSLPLLAAAIADACLGSNCHRDLITDRSLASPYPDVVVYSHNIHRYNHSVPAVAWNDKIAAFAQTTANKCVFAHDLTPGGGGYGQNIALYGQSNLPLGLNNAAGAQSVTDFWYNGELSHFPKDGYGKATPNMTNFGSWGHFSQVVWKSTIVVGCATVYCKAGTAVPNLPSYFTVCNYYPPGNVGGQYGANVLPPIGIPTIVV